MLIMVLSYYFNVQQQLLLICNITFFLMQFQTHIQSDILIPILNSSEYIGSLKLKNCIYLPKSYIYFMYRVT